MDNEKLSGIYCIENIQNNKKYVGQSINVESRMKEHKSHLIHNNHTNCYLQKSWNKYGKKNFKFYVLEFCSNDELDDREIYYINYYNSVDRKFGYNLKTGGQNGASRYSKESRKKMSESQKRVCEDPKRREFLSKNALNIWSNEEYKKSRSGENHWLYGKHHSEESRKKLSDKNKGKKKPKRSKEHCEALSRSKKGKKSPKRNTTPVRCIETGKIYCDAITAGREMGLKFPNKVISVCNGRQNTTSGYHFEFVK